MPLRATAIALGDVVKGEIAAIDVTAATGVVAGEALSRGFSAGRWAE